MSTAMRNGHTMLAQVRLLRALALVALDVAGTGVKMAGTAGDRLETTQSTQTDTARERLLALSVVAKSEASVSQVLNFSAKEIITCLKATFR